METLMTELTQDHNLQALTRRNSELNIVDKHELLSKINHYYDSEAIQFFEVLLQQQIHLGYFDDRYPHISLVHAAKRLTNVIIENLSVPLHGYLLDIGCGCGQPAIEIVKQKHCSVEGITINALQHKKAKQLARSLKLSKMANFTLGDASKLPYDDAQFDNVLLFESIHHIGHIEALTEAHRVLKAGSQILIADGVVLQDRASAENKKMLADTFVAKSLHTEKEIISLLKATGFINIELIDLSSAILPTWERLRTESQMQKKHICNEYGYAFYEQLIKFWQSMNQVWSQSAKYLMISGRKPV